MLVILIFIFTSLFFLLLHVLHVLVPELVIKSIVNLVVLIVLIIFLVLLLLRLGFVIHISVKVFFHFEVRAIAAFIAITVVFWRSFLLLFLTFVVLEALKLLLMLDLVGNILTASLSIADSLTIGFFLALAFTFVFVVGFIFLATEVLVDQVQENTLRTVTKLAQRVHDG